MITVKWIETFEGRAQEAARKALGLNALEDLHRVQSSPHSLRVYLHCRSRTIVIKYLNAKLEAMIVQEEHRPKRSTLVCTRQIAN